MEQSIHSICAVCRATFSLKQSSGPCYGPAGAKHLRPQRQVSLAAWRTAMIAEGVPCTVEDMQRTAKRMRSWFTLAENSALLSATVNR